MPILILAALLTAGDGSPAIDGRRLRAGAICYAITREGATIGATLQTVRPVVHGRRRAWDVVVHQRVPQLGFEMRDQFLLDARNLQPIRLESRRGSNRAARGWQHVVVDYAPDRIRGVKETADATTQIDVPLGQRVWDGNLWGLTFAALPLRAGGTYTVPFWQYDKGFGRFALRVVGSERVGRQDAWVVELGDDPARATRYWIGKRDHRELGYRSGPSGQREGGDCTGLG